MDLTSEIALLLEQYHQQTVEWVKKLDLLLVEAANNYLDYSTKDHASYDLSHTGVRMLYVILCSGGKTTQKKITKTIPVSKQAIAVVLNEFETRGIIEKRINVHDNRKREIFITKKGIILIKEILPIRANFYSLAASVLNENETIQILSILQKINRFYRNNIKRLDKQISDKKHSKSRR